MADSSLDEFFAKKDKSKRGKSRAKYTTSETIAKKLEESGKRVESTPKKDVKEKLTVSAVSNQSVSSTVVPVTAEQEDDEWKNIEEEKERDYSGLRIQALSISDKEKEEEQLKEQMSDQNGETSKIAESQSGPWKVVSSPAPVAVVSPVIEETPAPEPEVKEENKTMAYKPPALRNAPAPAPSGSSRRNPKSAPQISSELHFPSLSAAVETGKGKFGDSDRSFQSVKHGIRSKGDAQPGLQLDLENKFSALHQGDLN